MEVFFQSKSDEEMKVGFLRMRKILFELILIVNKIIPFLRVKKSSVHFSQRKISLPKDEGKIFFSFIEKKITFRKNFFKRKLVF